ncbi:esterase OVCA2 [Cimex lectularius]|uniref:Serine hydrolase domain-containing protein n=1 Tax=Cimex lectularius TaxID=79782 RepID=A0A8I6R5U3_CIMLE|nr:esterase OVCA2 [Cimex lectularius]
MKPSCRQPLGQIQSKSTKESKFKEINETWTILCISKTIEHPMENKLKILCLHGYRQDGPTFRSKIGSLRKAFKNIIFDTVDAPHISNIPSHDAENKQDLAASNPRSWWFTDTNKTYVSKIESDIAECFEESVSYIQDHVNKNGPYDGLFGFSQGATFAALICCLIQKGEFQANFKFVIIGAGFRSLCKPHLHYYNTKLVIPSLHIIGETDQVISKERCESLLEIFENPQILRHPGGHYIPASKEFKHVYKEFFDRFR